MAAGDTAGEIYENVGYAVIGTGQTAGEIYLGDVRVGLTHVGWGIPA